MVESRPEGGASGRPWISFEDSRPEQVRRMISERPVAYVPLGALEWHGEHGPLGLDGLKARALCESAAKRTGGVVFPAMYWGAFDTMPFPFTFHFKRKWLKSQVRAVPPQLAAMGFTVIVLLTGHYPPTQIRFLKQTCRRFNRREGKAFAIGVPEQAFATDLDYYGDHAGMWETSLMMALRPDLVRLEALPEGRSTLERKALGVLGQDPRQKADAELGRKALDHISANLARVVETTLAEQTDRAIEQAYRDFARPFRPSLDLLRVARVALDVHSVGEFIRYVMPYRKKDRKGSSDL